MDIENKVINIFNENGVEIIDKNEPLPEMDSINYISILVSLEQEFDIEFSDDFLIMENQPNAQVFIDIIKNETENQISINTNQKEEKENEEINKKD